MTGEDPARRAALERAYRATTYRARAPDGPIAIRVGEPNAALDALLARHGARCFAYVSACNPGSRPLGDADNRARHAALVAHARTEGLVAYEGEGEGDAPGDWAPEPSVLLVGLGREDARALGRRFGQNAVVCGEAGRAPALVWCD